MTDKLSVDIKIKLLNRSVNHMITTSIFKINKT